MINCYKFMPKASKDHAKDFMIIEVRSDRICWFDPEGTHIKTVQGLSIRGSHLIDNRYLYTLQDAQKDEILTEKDAKEYEQSFAITAFKPSGVFIYDLE